MPKKTRSYLKNLGGPVSTGLVAPRSEFYSYQVKQAELLQVVPRLSREFGLNQSCVIVSTPHNRFLARLMELELVEAGLEVTIADHFPVNRKFDYCFALSAHHFPGIPPWSVVFQLEQLQSDRWDNDGYMEFMRQADTIIDYSRRNLKVLEARGIVYNKTYYVPIDILPGYSDGQVEVEKDVDVLFYGDINSERRRAILRECKSRLR